MLCPSCLRIEMVIEVGLCVIPNRTVIALGVFMMVICTTGWNGRAGKGKDLLVLIVSLIVNLDCRCDRIYSHLGDKLLGLSVRMFPEKFIQGTPSLMGVTIPWAGRRMEVEYHHHPSLSASWLRMQCDQPPHDLTAVPSPSCWTMSTRTVSQLSNVLSEQ